MPPEKVVQLGDFVIHKKYGIVALHDYAVFFSFI